MSTEQDTTVPEKYRPEKRQYEQKDWLYEQYWGQFRSTLDMAEECGVDHKTITAAMEDHGIPRRCDKWQAQKGAYDPRDEWSLTTESDTTADTGIWTQEDDS